MKYALKKFIAAMALFVALAPLPAQAAVSVYADETETSGNAAVATQEAPDTANIPATGVTPASESSSGRPPVRIDKTGVHIGGPHPVDINVPALAHHGRDNDIDVVGILGVVCGCTVPIAIVGLIVYFNHRRNQMTHETMRAMIEKGMPIPPELLTKLHQDSPSQDRPYRARNDFRGGLILVGVGAGLLMIAGKVGWILVFIGAARLVFWLVEDRKP